jgi:hypothetical protein
MSAATVVPVGTPASSTLGGESAIVDGSPAIFWLQNPATASILAAAAAVAAQSAADHKNIPIAATSFNSSFKDHNRTTTSSYASSIP